MLSDVEEDSKPPESIADDFKPSQFTSIQHFFANHYNQLFTILADWGNDQSDFATLIKKDSDLNYTGTDSVLINLLKEAASNFNNCPMLKDSYQ